MDYKNGKVYKITDLNYTKQYIGSTTQPLYKRLSSHKSQYKTKNQYTTCHNIFDEFGIDNCIIILIEECLCENREQLLMREAYYIKNEKCVNKCLSYISNEDQKTKYKDYQKEFRKNNPEKIKLYKEQHKEEAKETRKKYDVLHKEERKIYQKIYDTTKRHKKTQEELLIINAKRREKRALKKESVKI